MGLFDKKYCDICGDKIGILGNRKLEDGNMCKECARKMSPWLTGRKGYSLYLTEAITGRRIRMYWNSRRSPTAGWK